MKRFFLIVVLMAVPVNGQAEQYSISGSVLVKKAGVLYIYLVDEKQFSIPLTGIVEIRKNLKEKREQKIPFSFSGIPDGEYGIRVYVDTNGNGKLDRGVFGPSEPWGMSWQGEPKRGIPRFEDIAFYVERDVKNIIIDTR
jgi:uncharacterized protein (DUF2141 family)